MLILGKPDLRLREFQCFEVMVWLSFSLLSVCSNVKCKMQNAKCSEIQKLRNSLSLLPIMESTNGFHSSWKISELPLGALH